MIYGNHSLQRNDRDGIPAINNQPGQLPVYGGVTNPPQAQVNTAETPQQGGATLAIPQYVEDLQRDLRELGFLIIKGDANGNISTDGDNSAGVFGMTTEWGVKEFQIYASMTHVAQLDLDALHALAGDGAGETAWSVAARGMVPAETDLPEGSTPHPVSYHVATLRQVANTARYTGPISGVVNQRTRDAIEHWKNNNYRCPVVIEAWRILNNQRSTLAADGVNIWHYNTVNSTPRIFFRDFTQYYTYPGTRLNNGYHVLGTFQSYNHRIKIPNTNPPQYITIPMGGPLSTPPNHTWTEAEALPETMTTTTLPALQTAFQADSNNATASTMRVVRAASEQECLAFIDSVNDYDACVTSIGLCHWTFALPPTYSDQTHYQPEGELAGFFAYFQHYDQAAYQQAFGNFGLYPSSLWTGRGVGNTLWNNTLRKYSGWMREHVDSIEPNQAATNLNQLHRVNNLIVEANYYKNWHWFFRFVMAGRTILPLHRAMWNAIRIRIDDIRMFDINATAGTINVQGTIGQIYTSEKAIAILLRFHIFSPGNMKKAARNAITNAIQHPTPAEQNLNIDWALALNQWTDNHERAITRTLLALAIANNDTQNNTATWPHYNGREGRHYALTNQLGNIRDGRNTFFFDNGGI
jgi:peptidoglycan hydrolase-like protein with peptidoglycan-binding domain